MGEKPRSKWKRAPGLGEPSIVPVKPLPEGYVPPEPEVPPIEGTVADKPAFTNVKLHELKTYFDGSDRIDIENGD